MISPSLNSCEHSLNTLRYADRVKELGAADPLDLRPSDTRQEEPGDDMVESTEDDLAQLRSLNVSSQGRSLWCTQLRLFGGYG